MSSVCSKIPIFVLTFDAVLDASTEPARPDLQERTGWYNESKRYDSIR